MQQFAQDRKNLSGKKKEEDSGGKYGVLYEEVEGRKTRGGGGFGLGGKVGKGRE
nr:hypothetical protein [Tanacetum cinerariifolium]